MHWQGTTSRYNPSIHWAIGRKTPKKCVMWPRSVVISCYTSALATQINPIGIRPRPEKSTTHTSSAQLSWLNPGGPIWLSSIRLSGNNWLSVNRTPFHTYPSHGSVLLAANGELEAGGTGGGDEGHVSDDNNGFNFRGERSMTA